MTYDIFAEIDWGLTPLGPCSSWASRLRQLAEIVSSSAQPMYVAWGPELITVCNRAYCDLRGSTGSRALGKSMRAGGALWSNVEPLVAEVLSGKPAVTENLPIMTTRGGVKEVAYFSTSYTPLFDDDGEVAGLLAIVAETTESIREQERIARERDRLQALFEEAPGFMAMTTGTEHRYVLANKAYRAMVGHEGLLGKTVFEVNPEFLGTGIPALLEQVYTTGEPFLGEEIPVSFLRVPDQPLEQRFVTFIYQPVKEAETDEVTGIFLEGFDLTKKRVSELALAEVTERLELAVQAHSIGIFDTDVQTGQVHWSKELEEIYGYRPGTFGTSLDAWRRHVLPADLPEVDLAFAEAIEAKASNVSYSYRMRRCDGEIRHIEASARLFYDHEGRQVRRVGVNIDVTDRKVAQDRLQALQSAVVNEYRLAETVGHVGHWRIKLPSKKMIWSDEIFHIVGTDPERGVPSPEEVLNLYHPDDRSRARNSLIRALKTGKSWDFIVRIVRPNGEVRYARSHGVAEHHQGTTTSLFGVLADVTELEHARQEAVEATAAKTSFLATMSHEIRTPLNSIIGFTDLLREDRTLSETQARYLQRIQNSGTLLLAVVNDILDLAKIEAGKIDLSRASFAVETLVDNTVAIVRAAADAKGVEMRVCLDPALAPHYIGDEARLCQVLLNLLNNAVKFTPDGYVSLQIRCLAQNAGTHRLRFSVSDTGVGIDPEKQKHVFEAFAQADVSVSREYGGTGLGLAICNRLVGVMGGRIGLSSSPGAGSTFWFEIDLPPGEKPNIGLSPVADAAERKSARILLVEDLPINQEVACAILSRAGHAVDVANDGAEAVRAVQQKEYDLVLMDIQMPKVDGITATKMIRALEGPVSRVPIVAMTANVLPEQVGEYKKIGTDGHVAKPIDQSELHRLIQSLLKDGARKRGDRREVLSAGRISAAAERLSLSTGPFDRATFAEVATLLPAERLQKHLASFEEQLTDVFRSRPSAELLKSGAHKLVSQAGMLGFGQLADQCRLLEQAVDDDHDVAESFCAAQAAAEETLALVEMLKADIQI